MTPESILNEISHKWSEHLEMTNNPGELIAWALAQRIVDMQSDIEALERRIKYVCKS